MKFRPCIDIHNGKVKQIVGESLKDKGDTADENFVSKRDAAFYAKLYKEHGLRGGHVILLNSNASPYYEGTKSQALKALQAYKNGLQVGGGITDENAGEFLRAGASHVIVTSYVFKNGELHEKNLDKLLSAVGKQHLVLDLSCRKRGADYYIVTDRWQKFTEMKIDKQLLHYLAGFCDEFLVHAVDVEGKAKGPELSLAGILGAFSEIPVTYAGGIVCLSDIDDLKRVGKGRLDITIGSALDLFGGNLAYEHVLKRLN